MTLQLTSSRPGLAWAVACAVTLTLQPAVGHAAKPTPAKSAAAKAAPAKPTADKGKTEEPKPAPTKAAPAQGLRADAQLAQLLAALDKALAAPAPTDDKQPDPAGALLETLARSSVVSVLHGHFALAGLGQALRMGAMPANEVGTMAKTLTANYESLGLAFGNLSNHKQFAGELADIFRSVQVLCQYAKTVSAALAGYAAMPNESGQAKAFEEALETYRSRLAALFVHLQAGTAKPAQP